MRYFIVLIAFLLLIADRFGFNRQSPEKVITVPDSSISLLFAGDIMAHMPQVNAAFDTATGGYCFDGTFSYVKPVFSEYDFVIANLETTLAGKPYSGYPQFSAPDELALACKNAGIKILETANNHCCDKGKQGITRTIAVLDSMGISHLGTYSDSIERAHKSPLIIEKNGIRVALLNYTFSTNGISAAKPVIVNYIDTSMIASDIAKATLLHSDKIILIMHWGNEYESFPNVNQKTIAVWCFSKGADIIIGSHPHVIQPVVWEKDAKDKVTFFSLGNFVSNQRKSRTDGGMMAGIVLRKSMKKTSVAYAGHYLTWVYNPYIDGRKKYYILPCSAYETDTAFFKTKADFSDMKAYIKGARGLLDSNNVNEKEYLFKNGKWE